jgi:hypothetical protein
MAVPGTAAVAAFRGSSMMDERVGSGGAEPIGCRGRHE